MDHITKYTCPRCCKWQGTYARAAGQPVDDICFCAQAGPAAGYVYPCPSPICKDTIKSLRAEVEALRHPPLRFLFAKYVTGDEAEYARSSPLYQHGDMLLVWVNEGDLAGMRLKGLATTETVLAAGRAP